MAPAAVENPRQFLSRAWAPAAVVLLGFLAYLPALDNPFVSDDYAFFWYVDRLQGHWTDPAYHPLGFRRVASTLFFALCYKLFGLAPARYYVANLLLHLLNAGLVGLLVGRLARDHRAGVAAALFFVAYERHQEAVFWIAAHHELFVSLGVMATVWFFWRYRTQGRWWDYALALGALAFSAVAKESFIVMAPLLVWLELCFFGWQPLRRWLAHAPFVLVAAVYAVEMYATRQEVPFYAVYYGITPHFFIVYAKTLNRLLLFVYGFLLLVWWLGRRKGGLLARLKEDKPFAFFLGWLLITIIPYSFLLYLDHLPSRQTYLPSVATAALVALLFVRAWEQAGSARLRYAVAVLLAACLAVNVLYLRKKDGQYLERAAPTEELIALLNRETPARPVSIYGFPYEPLVGEAAARYFTSTDPARLVFLAPEQAAPEGSLVLRWNADRKAFDVISKPQEEEEAAELKGLNCRKVKRERLVRRGLVVTVLALGLAGVTAAAAEPDPIRAGYELLYQGNSEDGYKHFRQLSEREPDNLAAAYGVLVALDARGLGEPPAQKEFEQRAEQLSERARARYDKNRQDKEALFYLAQVYGSLARYKFEQDKGIWGAARDAAKAKGYNEDYIKLDPSHADGYLTLGLYNYYVDLAPNFIKFLRVLLFLPGGNRATGLEQIERVARKGELFAPVAQLVLVEIYCFFEGRPEEGLRLARELQQRYPDNPEYRFLLARVYSSPFVEDFSAAAQQLTTIVQRAEQGHPHYQGTTRYVALRSLARARQQEWRIEDAIAALTPTIEARPEKPDWVMPSFLLSRANLRLLLNDPKAEEDTRRILAEAKWKSWHDAAKRQLKAIRERRSSGEIARYAELLPGNRMVAEGRWEEAENFYAAMRQKHPQDLQVRYRLAYLDFARGRLEPAASGFSAVANPNPARAPAWLRANALLYLARTHDLQGRREQAVQLYKKIVSDFEGEGAAGAARLHLLTPYRRIK